ncbi:MAG: hypothetical protein ABIQ35_09745, partial [Verrucomicrobiota bacterium]
MFLTVSSLGGGRSVALTRGDYTVVEREIKEFLSRQNLRRQFNGYAIDLFPSPQLRGWLKNEVTHIYAGEYVAPRLFHFLMQKYPPPSPVKEYFGLRQCSALGIADQNQQVCFELVGGNYGHIFVLQKIFQHRSDSDCQMFRHEFEPKW